ncbi:MAG: FtsX-like permease family protein [Bacteroidia bacterium]
MNFPFHIAKRYLVAKKSHNIINIISAIAVVGILFSTAALVIILSAFNGLEGLVSNLYNSFDSDIKIELKEGKTFAANLFPENELKNIPEIAHYSKIIEEVVLLKHNDNWVTLNIKGVEPSFLEMTKIDSFLIEGEPKLFKPQGALIGLGTQSQLGVSTNELMGNTLEVNALQRDKKIRRNDASAFNKAFIPLNGIYSISPDFDFKNVITPIDFASEVLGYDNEISAVEVDVKSNANHDDVKEKLEKLLGENFSVKTFYEQNEIIYSVHKIEKWFIYIILVFVLLLASFNILASLAMLIIDKQKDLNILRTMGANEQNIRKIFFYQGVMINLSGALLGLLLGLFVCWLQIEFHLVTLTGSIIDYYPVIIKPLDVALITLTVIVIGVTSSYLPTRYFLSKGK